METLLIVQPRAYYDSVTLMAASQQIAGRPGVAQAVLVMGTAHNKALLRDAGLLGAGAEEANPDDLIIAIQAADGQIAADAAAAVTAALTRKGDAAAGAVDQGGDLLGARARGADDADWAGADDVGEAQPDPAEQRGATIRPHTEQAALAGQPLQLDLGRQLDVVGEQQHVQAAEQGLAGFGGGELGRQ